MVQRPTPRQLEILALYSAGKNSTEIAEDLVLSPETVKWHIKTAAESLETRTVAHSIVVSLARGYLVIDRDGESAAVASLDLVAA